MAIWSPLPKVVSIPYPFNVIWAPSWAPLGISTYFIPHIVYIFFLPPKAACDMVTHYVLTMFSPFFLNLGCFLITNLKCRSPLGPFSLSLPLPFSVIVPLSSTPAGILMISFTFWTSIPVALQSVHGFLMISPIPLHLTHSKCITIEFCL